LGTDPGGTAATSARLLLDKIENTEALFQKLAVANCPEAVAIALRKQLLKI